MVNNKLNMNDKININDKPYIIENNVIGKNIKELRKEVNLSQTGLAKLLYLSQDTISLWECGKSLPDIVSLIRMSQIFGVSSDYILGIEK